VNTFHKLDKDEEILITSEYTLKEQKKDVNEGQREKRKTQKRKETFPFERVYHTYN
jgi:hypothetical protein